ncbi:transposase [Plakobranchus ocellatus]|uniref:Transposase n=1 Tax=Plakobranchus ocellatus TaxID=259542 RepID=A0AAV4B3R6_9GAST|nr:transposase [Plakobranchus ocellatus]
MTWKHLSSPVTKKFKVQRSAAKVMATVFWDAKGVILLDILPQVDCPRPATNCLHETFNRVVEHLGCLGCQLGCQPGYVMTANPKHDVRDGHLMGTYDYMNITIPMSKNVSEPQWLCLPGDSCPWGFFASKIGATDACSYCGEGCRSCQSYGHCDHCVMGYRLTKTQLPGGREASLCISSGGEFYQDSNGEERK